MVKKELKLKIEFYSDEGCCELSRNTKRRIRDSIRYLLITENFRKNAIVSINVVSAGEIRRLNAQYRGKDSETDVLSFPQLINDGTPGGYLPITADFYQYFHREKYVSLGDIILCEDVIREQAHEFGNTFDEEMIYMTIHSALHLLGYDHERSEEEKVLMTEKQDAIFNRKIKESNDSNDDGDENDDE